MGISDGQASRRHVLRLGTLGAAYGFIAGWATEAIAQVGKKLEVLIDTDPGMGVRGADPEDNLALMLALQSPELRVKAITTVFGNISQPNAYSKAC